MIAPVSGQPTKEDQVRIGIHARSLVHFLEGVDVLQKLTEVRRRRTVARRAPGLPKGTDILAVGNIGRKGCAGQGQTGDGCNDVLQHDFLPMNDGIAACAV